MKSKQDFLLKAHISQDTASDARVAEVHHNLVSEILNVLLIDASFHQIHLLILVFICLGLVAYPAKGDHLPLLLLTQKYEVQEVGYQTFKFL